MPFELYVTKNDFPDVLCPSILWEMIFTNEILNFENFSFTFTARNHDSGVSYFSEGLKQSCNCTIVLFLLKMLAICGFELQTLKHRLCCIVETMRRIGSW